ncbi:response regulator transcription factor [Acinetobacter seifertii]|nr:response regulator transcription factor [Acinetobacter seifertii]
MKVLLVEDEPEMASALCDALAQHNILLDHASNIRDAEIMLKSSVSDLLLLDRQLPDGDGLSLVGKIRAAEQNNIPVLMLTARSDISDRVDGLNSGADDYLAKPFVFEELLARLRALNRRPSTLTHEIVKAGNLIYDFTNNDAKVKNKVIELTRREILVLETLLRRFGRMVTRTSLMESVFSLDDEVQPNALDTQISRLRRKLTESESGLVISGVRGVGYLLREGQ